METAVEPDRPDPLSANLNKFIAREEFDFYSADCVPIKRYRRYQDCAAVRGKPRDSNRVRAECESVVDGDKSTRRKDVGLYSTRG